MWGPVIFHYYHGGRCPGWAAVRRGQIVGYRRRVSAILWRVYVSGLAAGGSDRRRALSVSRRRRAAPPADERTTHSSASQDSLTVTPSLPFYLLTRSLAVRLSTIVAREFVTPIGMGWLGSRVLSCWTQAQNGPGFKSQS